MPDLHPIGAPDHGRDPVSPVLSRLTRPVHLLVAAMGCVLLVTLAVACGDDGGGAAAETELSEAGARGRDISSSNGCAACHGSNGQVGAGPEWIGLADSDV
jgi:mono/diheme cytochrome c family protein